MGLKFFAKQLRKNSTDVEKLLWGHLRAKRLAGIKFRRQVPLGKYIVDFICFKKRLVVECDGSQHITNEGKDRERDNWFSEKGFTVLRFWDNQVLENLEEVLEEIAKHCGHS